MPIEIPRPLRRSSIEKTRSKFLAWFHSDDGKEWIIYVIFYATLFLWVFVVAGYAPLIQAHLSRIFGGQ